MATRSLSYRRLAAQHTENFRAWCEYKGTPHFVLAHESYRPCRPELCLIVATPLWLDWLHLESRADSGCMEQFREGVNDRRPLGEIEAGDFPTGVSAWRSRKGFATAHFVWHVFGEMSLLEVYFRLGKRPPGMLALLRYPFEWAIQRVRAMCGLRSPHPNSVKRWLRYDGLEIS